MKRSLRSVLYSLGIFACLPAALGQFSIDITQQPTSVVISWFQSATFSTAAQGYSNTTPVVVTYQWQEYRSGQSDWVDILNATNTTYITPRMENCLTAPLLFRCQFKAGDALATTSTATLEVVPDCSPPSVTSVVGKLPYNHIIVQFSDHMEPDSVSDIFNYALSAAGNAPVPVIESIYMTNAFTGVLVLATNTPLREDVRYTLDISDVSDFSDPACGCKVMFPASFMLPVVRECFRITRQPESRTLSESCLATFEVAARWLEGPSQLLNYQWWKDGNAIPGATNRTYTTPVRLADNNSRFQAVVQASCQSVTSAVASVIVVADQWLPFLNRFARPGQARDTIVLDFLTWCGRPNGRLDSFLAVDSFNYSVTGGPGKVDVWYAGLDCTGLQVLLVTSPQEPLTEYTVSVSGLQDETGNVIPGISTATFTSPARTPVSPGRLNSYVEADQLILEWGAGGILQESHSSSGPWRDVEFSASPYLVNRSILGCHLSGLDPQFFRVRWNAP